MVTPGPLKEVLSTRRSTPLTNLGIEVGRLGKPVLRGKCNGSFQWRVGLNYFCDQLMWEGDHCSPSPSGELLDNCVWCK